MVEYSTKMEPKPNATAAPDDAHLIQAIVRDRSREAFADLVKRFEQPAFQLALHLTNRRALAEEAVQDALLAVWHGAESFRPDGDLRRWILGIVAHRALRAARKERKSQRAMDYQREILRAETERQRPEAGAERGELLGALRELLGRLPEAERKLVALYYGAGMTQEEIGAALDMPQRTVSFKLQACLDHLRKNLAQAGMAAAAPLLTPQVLGSVFESGPETAPGLAARTLARCDRPYVPRESGAHSARAAAKGSGTGLAVAAGLAGLVLVGGYALMKVEPPAKPAAREAPPQPAVAKPAPPPPETPKALPPQSWTYDFKQPPGEGFEHVLGPLRWGRVEKARANCIIVDSMTANSGFLLPLRKPRMPLLVKVRYWILAVGHCRLAIGWTDGKQGVPVRSRNNSVRNFDGMKGMEVAYYFLDGFAIESHANEFSEFYMDRIAHSHERIYVFGRNIGIECVEVKELRADEVPEAVRDRDALVKRLGGSYTDMPGYSWGNGNNRPLAEYLKEQAAKK